MATLLPRAERRCRCHGNHREFVVERDDTLLWDVTFDQYEWEKVLRSMAGKASGQLCDPTIVQALEVAEERLVMFGPWYNNPALWRKLRCLGINWRCPKQSKPRNCYVQLVCQQCDKATLPLQILTNRDHCRRFLKTFHDLDEGIVLPPPELTPTTQHQTGLTQHQIGRQPPPPPPATPPRDLPPPGLSPLPASPPPGLPPAPPPGQPPRERRGVCNYDALRMQRLVPPGDMSSTDTLELVPADDMSSTNTLQLLPDIDMSKTEPSDASMNGSSTAALATEDVSSNGSTWGNAWSSNGSWGNAWYSNDWWWANDWWRANHWWQDNNW